MFADCDSYLLIEDCVSGKAEDPPPLQPPNVSSLCDLNPTLTQSRSHLYKDNEVEVGISLVTLPTLDLYCDIV